MLRAAAAVPGEKQVWAVGGTEKGQTVTALLSGGHWALVPSPSQGRGDRLDAVSAYSTSFAAAVGYHVNKFGLWQPLALIWNGSSWQTGVFHRIAQESARSREDCLREVVRRYSEHMHSNVPVHEWPLA